VDHFPAGNYSFIHSNCFVSAMVNILVAPDKFKGSLSAVEVCQAVEQGLSASGIKHALTAVPMADGGEGTFDLLLHYFKGTRYSVTVTDPLFQPVQAGYGISQDGITALIEMASASGLQLIDVARRNPLYTTTYGTGELIRKAIGRGVRTVILGIGGSATNDAGIGMASALGYEFFDSANHVLKPIGENLLRLHSIGNKNVLPALRKVEFIVLCDVTNPLHGPRGAAYVYAPQKGATSETISLLDDGLRNFEAVAKDFFKIHVDFPGAGAAGGLGAGTRLFLAAELHKGIDYILKVTGLEKKVQDSDLVITGEGRLDTQSLSGKVVMEVARLASSSQKPVIVICGKNELTDADILRNGIRSVLSLTDKDTSEKQAMTDAFNLIKNRIARHFSEY
jgi:glycerate kinase